MNETKFKQSDRVYFEMGENLPKGWGKICGVAGPILIVELETPIKGYEYTHTYIVDAQIKEPPVTK